MEREKSETSRWSKLNGCGASPEQCPQEENESTRKSRANGLCLRTANQIPHQAERLKTSAHPVQPFDRIFRIELLVLAE
jgi:hypothetical protein